MKILAIIPFSILFVLANRLDYNLEQKKSSSNYTRFDLMYDDKRQIITLKEELEDKDKIIDTLNKEIVSIKNSIKENVKIEKQEHVKIEEIKDKNEDKPIFEEKKDVNKAQFSSNNKETNISAKIANDTNTTKTKVVDKNITSIKRVTIVKKEQKIEDIKNILDYNITLIEPSVFKVLKNSSVLDSNMSFRYTIKKNKIVTSSIKRGDYVKITGKIDGWFWKINENKDDWIHKDNIVKRPKKVY